MNQKWVGIALLLAIVVAGAVVARFSPGSPQAIEIREVWEHHELYEGKSLSVSGTLRRFLAGLPKEHYAVESSDAYRIGVESTGLEALEGLTVTAEGPVIFDEESGLRLEPATVTAR